MIELGFDYEPKKGMDYDILYPNQEKGIILLKDVVDHGPKIKAAKKKLLDVLQSGDIKKLISTPDGLKNLMEYILRIIFHYPGALDYIFDSEEGIQILTIIAGKTSNKKIIRALAATPFEQVYKALAENKNIESIGKTAGTVFELDEEGL